LNQQSSFISSGNEKPPKIQIISILILINGILNILFGLGVTFAVVVSTIGIGLLCAPLTILPTILGIFEILAASKLLATPMRKPANLQVIAILEIVSIITGNFVSMVIGIINIVLLNDAETKNFFQNLPQ
jgi:hypothetical protein